MPEQAKTLETSYLLEFEKEQLPDCFGAEVEGKSRFQVQGVFDKKLSVDLAKDEPSADITELMTGSAGVVQCKFKADRVDLKKDDDGNEYLYLRL